MLKQPAAKYRPFQPVDLPDRVWPTRVIDRAPIWMSTDLRDGNQALFEPMNAERKLRLFNMLVQIGFKEIEVAFPSASDTDFQFVRMLIDGGHIPDDVTIEVLTQAREDLIRRTFDALRGAPRAIVHLYNATAPAFRRIVFGTDRAGCRQLAVDAARLMRQLVDERPETAWTLQYSPETFTATELEFAKDVCDAVFDIWQPTPDRKAIVNLPATVEIGTPNHYADQIEWMHRRLARRDSLVLSVHPHNDRGTAVAAAELAVMAGADRIEGCLFGNGERTGNVDLVTLALNLYTQGVDPGLDFSRIDDVARVAEACTQLPIHPRHPYVGDLVFTAFSGSHQDAIKKGFAAQRPDAPWEVPYLPLDPADVGRTYDSIIRVNSQSGKGGIAYLLEQAYGVTLQRRLQIDFSAAVQRVADDSGCELTASQLWCMFCDEYAGEGDPLRYVGHALAEADGRQRIALTAEFGGRRVVLHGSGNGPLDALMDALRVPLQIRHYEERALSQGADAQALAIAEVAGDTIGGSAFGVGVDANLTTASIRAVLNGVNRAYARADVAAQQAFRAALGDASHAVAVVV